MGHQVVYSVIVPSRVLVTVDSTRDERDCVCVCESIALLETDAPAVDSSLLYVWYLSVDSLGFHVV